MALNIENINISTEVLIFSICKTTFWILFMVSCVINTRLLITVVVLHEVINN